MRKVNCESCGAAYEVDPRRIPANGMKMRCPACGASVHVAPEGAPASAQSAAKDRLSELDLDLPAPKAKAPVAPAAASLPPVKPKTATPYAKLPELSDLPAVKAKAPARAMPSLSSAAGDDLLADLPAPKTAAGTKMGLGKQSMPSQSLPSPALDPLAAVVNNPDKKTAPAKLKPVALPPEPIGSVDLLSDLDIDIDLPAPKAKADPFADRGLDIDLPAPKGFGAAKKPDPLSARDLEVDLPAPKSRDVGMPKSRELDLLGGSELDIDLPAPKGNDLDLPAPKAKGPGGFELAPKAKPQARTEQKTGNLDKKPASFDAPTPHGLDLDAPLAGATPKKSFAKPDASAKVSPLAMDPTPPRAEPSSGGMLPKDSLAMEPRPFFASAPPHGMFGKLDDVHADKPMTAPTPSIDVIDLPAPQDLPAVKRPAAKGTSLGLGARTMPKDSLDLPAEFSQGGMALPEILPAQPAPAAPMPELSELDLPAPRDLPAVKKRPPAATALGLGANFGQPGKGTGGFEVQLIGAPSKGGSAAAVAKSATSAAAAREPELSLDLPPLSPREGEKNELDLGDFELALDKLESKGGGSFGSAELDLPPRAPAKRDAQSFGDLEPIALPSAGASNTNQLGLGGHTMELAPSDLTLAQNERGLSLADSGAQSFGRRGGVELGGMGDLSSLPPVDARGGGGGEDFGELDLGLGRDSSAGLPVDVPQRRAPEADLAKRQPARAAADAEDAEFTDFEAEKKSRVKSASAVPAWVYPIALLVLIAGTGTVLGMFTEYGWFGVYLVEQMLPAAGNPARVHEAIEQAERQAKTDAYADVRRSLVTLSDARNEAGLNRELLARSLLHESLYQLRFGEDAASAQRAAAILTRVLERGTSAPGLSLARAADAARRNDLTTAKALLAEVPTTDRYRGLVAGELALLEKQPDAAATQFQAAIAAGETGRGQWGLARAQLAAGKLDEAEAAAKATLAASPRHSPAHVLAGERALARGAIDEALTHARAAAGLAPIEGQPAKPSRQERARGFALEGHVEELRDHPREAQAAYERALAADPRSVPELLGSGRMLMRLGRPQEALSRFDSALSAKPSAARDIHGNIPLLEAGSGTVQALLALQRPQEALARSTALLAQFPAEAEVKLWHGHVLEALERFEDAEASFREAIEKAPTSFSGYVALSQLLFARGRPEEAARTLSLATGQVKDSAEVRRMLGNSELARNHLPEAITQFQAALKFDASDPGALYGLAVSERRSGHNEQATSALDRLLKADATFPGIALERGQVLEARGEFPAAIAAYREALAQRPTDTDLKLRLGAALVIAGQVDEAESVLNQVLKERPASAEAEHYLGRVLFARNETAQAAQRFERAVNLDMLKSEYHMYLAWALVEQGNFGGALESVQKAIQRDPNNGDARWILGRIQMRTGAVKDALGNFQAALRLNPSRTEALANIGDAYDELRELPQAIKSYQEVLKKAPDRAEWWYRLGQLELDKGRREEARAALSEAVTRGDKLREKPNWLAEAHRAYGDVLRESHRNAEAAEHYRLFLELAPLGHKDRGEIEQLLYQMKSK